MAFLIWLRLQCSLGIFMVDAGKSVIIFFGGVFGILWFKFLLLFYNCFKIKFFFLNKSIVQKNVRVKSIFVNWNPVPSRRCDFLCLAWSHHEDEKKKRRERGAGSLHLCRGNSKGITWSLAIQKFLQFLPVILRSPFPLPPPHPLARRAEVWSEAAISGLSFFSSTLQLIWIMFRCVKLIGTR